MNDDIKPPTRLPDGKTNPKYTAWYRRQPGNREKKNQQAREKRGSPRNSIDELGKPKSKINGVKNPEYYKWYRSRATYKEKKKIQSRAKRMRRDDPKYIEKCRKSAEKTNAKKQDHPEWEDARLEAVKNSQKVKDAIRSTFQKNKEIIWEKNRNNPQFQHGPKHHSAMIWQVRSPRGKTYIFKNLSYFLDKNRELFDEEDVIMDKGFTRCKAYAGINSIKPYKKNGSPVRRKVNSQWKCWQWVWGQQTLLP
jgi:hypothetical protein